MKCVNLVKGTYGKIKPNQITKNKNEKAGCLEISSSISLRFTLAKLWTKLTYFSAVGLKFVISFSPEKIHTHTHTHQNRMHRHIFFRSSNRERMLNSKWECVCIPCKVNIVSTELHIDGLMMVQWKTVVIISKQWYTWITMVEISQRIARVNDGKKR